MNDQTLREYYNQRANVYEKIYEKPERQADLVMMTDNLQQIFKNKTILEIACGTGYWTERLAKSATSIVGMDQSAEVLEIAQRKKIPNARFISGDAYDLASIPDDFSAGFAGFWLSHVPKR